jgi:hypothetical protein
LTKSIVGWLFDCIILIKFRIMITRYHKETGFAYHIYLR